MRAAISGAIFRDEKPPLEMVVSRLCLILHKLPSEIRTMSIEELDAIGYLMQCDQKKTDEEARIRQAKSNMK